MNDAPTSPRVRRDKQIRLLLRHQVCDALRLLIASGAFPSAKDAVESLVIREAVQRRVKGWVSLAKNELQAANDKALPGDESADVMYWQAERDA
jgi:hypothetical protein